MPSTSYRVPPLFTKSSHVLSVFNATTESSPNHAPKKSTLGIPKIFTEVLVRELQALGKALEERDGELEALTERLEMAFADSKNERARQGFLRVNYISLLSCTLYINAM